MLSCTEIKVFLFFVIWCVFEIEESGKKVIDKSIISSSLQPFYGLITQYRFIAQDHSFDHLSQHFKAILGFYNKELKKCV